MTDTATDSRATQWQVELKQQLAAGKLSIFVRSGTGGKFKLGELPSEKPDDPNIISMIQKTWPLGTDDK
jgi:hypothetical protein